MTNEYEFQQAVQQNSQRLFLIALSFVRERADAEDIVQTVFLRLLQRKKPFADDVHRDKWLTTVTVNACRSFLRSPFRARRITSDPAREFYTFETERDLDLFRAVMRLPTAQRTVIHLFYYEDLSVREIASLLHLRESAVKTRLNRARTALKTILTEDNTYE